MTASVAKKSTVRRKTRKSSGSAKVSSQVASQAPSGHASFVDDLLEDLKSGAGNDRNNAALNSLKQISCKSDEIVNRVALLIESKSVDEQTTSKAFATILALGRIPNNPDVLAALSKRWEELDIKQRADWIDLLLEESHNDRKDELVPLLKRQYDDLLESDDEPSNLVRSALVEQAGKYGFRFFDNGRGGKVEHVEDLSHYASPPDHEIRTNNGLLQVWLDPPRAKLANKEFNLSKEAAAWLKSLIQAKGQWKTMAECAKERDILYGQTKSGRIKASLPSELQAVVDSQPGKGSRLLV